MKSLTAVLLALVACVGAAQDTGKNTGLGAKAVATTAQSEQAAKPPDIDYLQKAAQGSIFIYDGNTKPCDDSNSARLLPLGSAFVIGLTNKDAQVPAGQWAGWQFLITALHVVKSGTGSIILRLNRTEGESGFVCVPVELVYSGQNQNVYTLDESSDVAAVILPNGIPQANPTVFAFSLLLDDAAMKAQEIKVGTNVFSVGYFYGYSGQKQNYPITKFGRISLLSSEPWYVNPITKTAEQAYVVELQNTPGLSGAPVMTYGVEWKRDFRYRELGPMVVGIVKGMELVPLQKGPDSIWISQGIATVEPASHIKALLMHLADLLIAAGKHPSLD